MADEHDYLDELVRLQVLNLRKELENQNAIILELARAGFSSARIADLLGTTLGTVKTTLSREKKRAANQPKAKEGTNGNT